MDEFEPSLKKINKIFTKEFVSKYIYIFVIGVVLLFGISYSLTFFIQNESVATGSFVALGLDISFSNRGINASDLTPSENDPVGMLEFVKTLTISNNEAADGNVIVRLNRTSGLNLSDMRYSLKINNVIKEVGDVPTNGEMLSSSIFSGEMLNIEVRLWPRSDYSGSETTFVGELEGDVRYLGIVANSYDNLNNAYVYFNCSGNTCEIWRIVKVENGRLVLTREEDLVGASSRVDSGRYNPNLTFNDNSMITSVSTDNKNVYLAKTVKIVGGSGTALDPYTLANNEYSENDNKIIGIITYKEEDRTTVIGTQPIYYGRTNYVSRQTTNPETEDWIGDNNNTYMYGSVIEAQGDINLYICSKEEYQIFYSGNGATQLANNNLLLKYDGLYHNDTTIIDLSQRGRNKPTTNVTFTNDYMQFNGTSSWVHLGENNSNYMTLEVTFMIDEFTQEEQEHIISSQESGGAKICIINNSTTDHRIRAVFYINGDNRYIDYNDLEIGKKYHVAATYDGVDMIMYVNGIEVGRNEISGYTIVAPTSGTPTVLGVDPNSTGSQNRYFFKGKIYNVAIYSTALSAGQVELDAGMFITKNSMYGQLPTPQRHDYQFRGWYTAPTGGTQITSSTVFTGNSDTTIYARWEPSYHIFYSGNGSTQLNNGNLIAKYDSLYHNGSTLTNISGKNKDGTATDVTFTNDYMQFNGTSSWVNLGEMNYDYMTLEVTFMVDTFIESGMQIILSNMETAGVQIYIYNTNGEHRINSVFYINGEAKYLLYHNVEVGKKYHVVTTYDGTNYIMYVNGFEVGRQVCSGYTITAPDSGTPMVLGVDPTTTGSQNRRYFTGKIYNAAIYSSALSAEQVALDAGKILSNNDTYGELPTPERYGYQFNGWYTAPTGGTQITSSTVFTGSGDTTIYARWTPVYHIFYSGYGATHLNNSNLIGKYDALYRSGTTLTDISGKNKDGTATDVTFTSNYMQFNGSSSLVNLGTMNSNYMTLEVTFSVDELLTTGLQHILSNMATGGGAIWIRDNSPTHKICTGFYINGEWLNLCNNKEDIELGKKYHVVAAYNGTVLELYVNGVKKGSATPSSSDTIGAPTSGTPMALGTDAPGGTLISSRYFHGKIYNAAIYNTGLSASQATLDAGKDLTPNSTYGTLPTPQRYGYSFDGWYTAASGGTQITSSTVFTGNSDTTIYARWVDDLSPTITLSPNSSTSNGTTKNVTVTLADAGSGLASGASVKYGWSTSNTTAPTSYTTASLSYSAGAKSTTFTATGTFDSGIRYLWVVPTTLEDVNGNSQTQNKVSGVFNFAFSDTTAPNITCKVNSSGTDGVTVTVTASDSESGLSVDPSVSHANIVSTRTYTATNGVGLSSSCTVTVKKWSRYDKKRYACTKGTWGSGSSSYVTSCTSISQSSANSSNSNTYVTCTAMNHAEALSACGSMPCYYKKTYSRTGCSTYSSSGTTISTGLSSCDASSNKNYKYTCTKYYTYTGSVS